MRLPKAVPLTVGSGGTREPLGRMQGPAGRSQTGMQGSSKDKGSVPQTLEASESPELTPPLIFLKQLCKNVPALQAPRCHLQNHGLRGEKPDS